jgi:hypothetical protein
MRYSVSSLRNLKTTDALVPLVHELKRSLAKGIITIKKGNSNYGY